MAFLFRLRIAILVFLALATAGATAWTFHGFAVPVSALFWSSASLSIGAAVAFVHLRHAGLAVLVALAPLPGMIAAGPLATDLAFSGFLAVYGFGTLAAACLCGDVVRGILDGSQPAAAAQAALGRAAAPVGLGAIAGAILLLGWLFHGGRVLGIGAAVELAGVAASILAFVPFVSASLPFGEPFFAAANRTRERRERLLALAGKVVEPRWGLSLSGIALVLVTLGWFGAAPLLARSALLAQPALWSGSAALLFGLAFAAGRDWRDALAATFALATLTLVSMWLWGRAVGHLSAGSLVEIAIAASAALFVMARSILDSRRYRRSGDRPEVARLRAIEALGAAPWFGVLGAAGAALPWILLHGSIATLAAMFLLAGAAGALLMPALATALETVLRRRRSVDELYGRG